MVEYITKEQAIGVVEEAIANIVNSDSEMVCLTDLEIEIQMTITDYTEPADVAPVVHARWIIMKVAPIAREYYMFNKIEKSYLQNECMCSF